MAPVSGSGLTRRFCPESLSARRLSSPGNRTNAATFPAIEYAFESYVAWPARWITATLINNSPPKPRPPKPKRTCPCADRRGKLPNQSVACTGPGFLELRLKPPVISKDGKSVAGTLG